MNSFRFHLSCLGCQPMGVVTSLAGINQYKFTRMHVWFNFPCKLSMLSLHCRDASTAGLVKVRATYPFGLDPKWHGTRSELPFLNSMKMKMSILFGVAQMNLGIIISYFNAKFFGDNINIW